MSSAAMGTAAYEEDVVLMSVELTAARRPSVLNLKCCAGMVTEAQVEPQGLHPQFSPECPEGSTFTLQGT